jgi:hypothetical protein
MKLFINDKQIDYSDTPVIRQLVDEGRAKANLNVIIEENKDNNFFLQIFIEGKNISLQYKGPEYVLQYDSSQLKTQEIWQMIESFVTRGKTWRTMVDWKKTNRKVLSDSNAFYAKLSQLQVLAIFIISLVPLGFGFWFLIKTPSYDVRNNITGDIAWVILCAIGAAGSYINWRYERYLRIKENYSFYEYTPEIKSFMFMAMLVIMSLMPIFCRYLKQ